MPRQKNLYPAHTRETVVHQYFELEWTAVEIAESFGSHPCRSTVYNIINDQLADPVNGLVKIGRLGSHNTTRKLDEFAVQQIVDIVQNHEGSSLEDIAEELQARTGSVKPWTRLDICRALNELGFSRVRVTSRAYEADEPHRTEYRDFCVHKGLQSEQFVFIDEVAFVSSCCASMMYVCPWNSCRCVVIFDISILLMILAENSFLNFMIFGDLIDTCHP
jgi:transposase